MADVIVAIHVARIYNRLLNKIELQKFIYLTDIIKAFQSELPPQDAHITYKRGPYDKYIQNAVDALLFRGLLVISSYFDTGTNTYVSYALSDAGLEWAESLEKVDHYEQKFDIAMLVAEKLNEYGWKNIVRLVYAEPTFHLLKTHGYGNPLPTYSPTASSSRHLINILEHAVLYGYTKKQFNILDCVNILFTYLDTFSKRYLQS